MQGEGRRARICSVWPDSLSSSTPTCAQWAKKWERLGGVGPGRGRPRGPFAARGGEPPLSCAPRRDKPSAPAEPRRRSARSRPPRGRLGARDDAGGPAVPSRSGPGRAGAAVRGRGRARREPRAGHAAASPLLRLERFQAEAQRRGLRAPRLLPVPSAASPAAGSSSPCLPLLRSLRANFPEPRPAAQSSPAAEGPLRSAERRPARLGAVAHPRAPGALRRERNDARGWGPRRSPRARAGRCAFG